MFDMNRTIALVEPGPSPEAEREFHKFSDGKVSVLTTRIPFDRMTSSGLSDMLEKLPLAVESIVAGRPELVAINSFTGSCLKGPEMINTVQQLTGSPAIVPAIEMAKYLIAMGAKRIALASAFGKEYNLLEQIFFGSQNIEITKIVPIPTGSDFFQIQDPYLISRISPMTVVEHVRNADLSGVDALVLDSPTFTLDDMIDNFETFLKIPVLSTNQVLLYSAFRHVGVSVDNLVVAQYLK